MLKIAICDDEVSVTQLLENLVMSYKTDKNIDIATFTYNDGNSLLLSKERFDLIFLDVEMEELNGVEVAQKIRELDMNIAIVYVTSYPEYRKMGYRVHAYDYIEKPFRYSDIETVLNDFIASREQQNDHPVSFTTDDGIIVIDMNSIKYCWMEKKRTVKIYTSYSEYVTRETFSNILNKLDKEMFYQTSRNYIVNLKYVDSYLEDDGITLKYNIWVPLSKNNKKDFYLKLSDRLRQYCHN